MEYLYETHMHTSEVSECARSTAAEQVRSYKEKGYTGIIVTDHFINGNSRCPRDVPWKKIMDFFVTGYYNAKNEGDKIGLDVFFGWEYTINGSDFLSYGMEPEFLYKYTDFGSYDIAKYSAVMRENGGFIAQAHPFRKDWYIAYKFPVEPCYLDGIEVFNSSMPDETNNSALEFAIQHGLPMQAGSDSHNASIPFTSGIVLDKKADSIFDIINAIKANNKKLIVPEGQMYEPYRAVSQ